MPKFTRLMNAMKDTDSEGPDARTAAEGLIAAHSEDVDIDHYRLENQGFKREKEFLDASWDELLRCASSPEGGITEEKLEEIFSIARTFPPQEYRYNGGQLDLLYTVRNLLNDHAEVRGFGEIRLAYHAALRGSWVGAEIPLEIDDFGTATEVTKYRQDFYSPFHDFEIAYDRFVCYGTFECSPGDERMKKIVEMFIQNRGVVTSENQKEKIYFEGVFAAIRGLKCAGITPEMLLQKRVVLEGEIQKLFSVDLTGVADRELVKKIERAAMRFSKSEKHEDVVYGYADDLLILEVRTIGRNRPNSIPTLADVRGSIERNWGTLTDDIAYAHSLVELLCDEKTRLSYTDVSDETHPTYSYSSPSWQYMFRAKVPDYEWRSLTISSDDEER